jgi:hypothetical protein
MRLFLHGSATLVALALACAASSGLGAGFNFEAALYGPGRSLHLRVESVDRATGAVFVEGGDARRPSTPFAWRWGDGAVARGFFPQSHTYTNRTRNYVVSVMACYEGGTTSTVDTVVWFTPPRMRAGTLAEDAMVKVATAPQTLLSREPGYGFSPQLTHFVGTNFNFVPPATIEAVLTAATSIGLELANRNVELPDGRFRQVVMRDLGGGFYSVWYSTPAAFAAGDTLTGEVPWTSFFHEIGHNLTLNSPAGYRYGGRTDGNANGLISETLAQIFQHAITLELVNRSAEFGLGPELAADVRRSALASMDIVVSAHRRYLEQGRRFYSWDQPDTPNDETFDTFMTLAFEFFTHAEQVGGGYRVPLQRLMQALQLFNPDWLRRYDPAHDTSVAASFRATLWVAALSHAFQTDLRPELVNLGFPVDPAAYGDLAARMKRLPAPSKPSL